MNTPIALHFDDFPDSVRLSREIVADVIEKGQTNGGGMERLAPLVTKPRDFVRRLERETANGLFAGFIDLHVSNYVEEDFSRDFRISRVKLDGGSRVGLVLFEEIILPRVRSGAIKNVPFAILSSHEDELIQAKKDYIANANPEDPQLVFLLKPLKSRDKQARELVEFTRHAYEIERIHGYEKLKVDRFSAIASPKVVRQLMSLFDVDSEGMAKILSFRDAKQFSGFLQEKRVPDTNHWKAHVVALYDLSAILFGLARSLTSEEKKVKQIRSWMSSPLPALANLRAVDVLRKGELLDVYMLQSYFRGEPIGYTEL